MISIEYELTTQQERTNYREQLLERNPRAWTHLDYCVRQIAGKITKRAGARKKSFQDEVAVNALSNIFERKMMERYDPSYPLEKWLYKIIRRESIDCLRRNSTKTRRAQIRVEGIEPIAKREEKAGEDEKAALYRAMLRLPQQYQVALAQRYLEGMSPKEIAQIIGITETGVRTRIGRGINRLRTLVTAA